MSRYYPSQQELHTTDRLERVMRDIYDRLYSVKSVAAKVTEIQKTVYAAQRGSFMASGSPSATAAAAASQYGSMYANNVSRIVTITAVDTYIYIEGSMEAGTSTSAFTLANNRELVCSTDGIYLVTWSMSLNCNVVPQDVSGCVMVNTTAQPNTTSHAHCETAAKNVVVSGTGVITLAADDLVRLAAANHTAVNNLLMEHANLTILRLA